jgi:hypothetical protein
MIGRVAIALAATALSACAATRPRLAADTGIAACAAGASQALLSVEALQCWLPAPHGHWRTLSHESHFDVLVVQVEAFERRDAEAIARLFVAGQRETFTEILVYVREPSRDPIRRVRWSLASGFEVFDFTGQP